MEGIVLPEFKDKNFVATINRTLELSVPTDNTHSRNLAITIHAKKFRNIGHDIILCQGAIPLSHYLEQPTDTKKLRVVLHTPSDDVPLAILFLNLQKVGYRMEEDMDEVRV